MRIFFVVSALAIGCGLLIDPAKSTTYNVDLLGALPDGVSYGPTGFASTNICSATTCAGGFSSTRSFQAQPGDTINFGTVSLSPFIFGDGRNQQYSGYLDEGGILRMGYGTPVSLYLGSIGKSYQYLPFLFLGGGVIASCNSFDPNCFSRLLGLLSAAGSRDYDLSFTLPDGFIEFGWTYPAIYTAPTTQIPAVPEPSTWVMMILGFISISAMTFRSRKQKVANRGIRLQATQ